jgi:hypothetical protein
MNKLNAYKKAKIGYSLKELEEIVRKQEPKTSWGNWKLDKEHQVLELLVDGNWKTEIDLERCTSYKETWHCLMHLDSKKWITADDIADAIQAMKYLIGYKGYWRSK